MAYSILIVEDEPLELQALTKLIGRYASRITSIFQASDSMEALSVCRAHMPDIILMDVNIPGQSGLEVLETLRSEGFQGVAVIITAYSQFEYAQAALRIHAMDYLLKPIDCEELYACLEKAFHQLDKTVNEQHRIAQLQQRVQRVTSYVQPIALHALVNGTAKSSMMPMLFDWPLETSLQAVVLRCAFDRPLDEDEQRCFYFDFYALCPSSLALIAALDPEEILFAIHAPEQISPAQFELILWCICIRMQQFARERGQNCCITGSRLLKQYQDFACLPRLTAGGFQASVVDLPMMVIRTQDCLPARDIRMRQTKAVTRYKAGTPEKIPALYKTLLSDEETKWAGVYGVLSVLYEVNPDTDVMSGYQAVVNSDEPPLTALTSWISATRQHAVEQTKATTNSFIIEQVLEIVCHEYANPMLSQADIAEQLGLSQAYFSRLFKKETGETFISHLTNVRLCQAQTLLREGLSVQEVAEQCGYQSKKYFLDVFRQNTGKTVTQYLDEVRDA